MILALGLMLAMLIQQPCATAVITLGQSQLQQGQTQSIQTQVTNCASGKMKYRVTVTVTDAIGSTVILRNDAHSFNANQSITLPDSYTVAANAPLGTYRVISIVFHTANGQTVEVARDVKEFQVVS